MEEIILVNDSDNEIGFSEKLKAHKENKLHRAFSVFVFNSENELLLQKRHSEKYHSGGLWTNTCCSHPRKNEYVFDAAKRRLFEEMGVKCDLKEVGKFHYQVKLEDSLWENEIDHVFIGKYDGRIDVHDKEVEDHKCISLDDLYKDIRENPNKYTYWFKKALEKFDFKKIVQEL